MVFKDEMKFSFRKIVDATPVSGHPVDSVLRDSGSSPAAPRNRESRLAGRARLRSGARRALPGRGAGYLHEARVLRVGEPQAAQLGRHLQPEGAQLPQPGHGVLLDLRGRVVLGRVVDLQHGMTRVTARPVRPATVPTLCFLISDRVWKSTNG